MLKQKKKTLNKIKGLTSCLIKGHDQRFVNTSESGDTTTLHSCCKNCETEFELKLKKGGTVKAKWEEVK